MRGDVTFVWESAKISKNHMIWITESIMKKKILRQYLIYIYIYIYILLIIINKFRNAYVFNTKVPSKVHHINYFIFFSDSRNGSVIKYLRNKIIYYLRTTSFVFKLYII